MKGEVKLTPNQVRVLVRMADGLEWSAGSVGGSIGIAGSSARSAINGLLQRGYVSVADARSPMTYRITDAGRSALAAMKE